MIINTKDIKIINNIKDNYMIQFKLSFNYKFYRISLIKSLTNPIYNYGLDIIFFDDTATPLINELKTFYFEKLTGNKDLNLKNIDIQYEKIKLELEFEEEIEIEKG